MNQQLLPGEVIQLAESNGWESIRKQDSHIDGYSETFQTENHVEIGVEDRTEVGGSTTTHVLVESPVLKITHDKYVVTYPFFKNFDAQYPHIQFNIAYATTNWGHYFISDPVDYPPTPEKVEETRPPDTMFMYVFFSWEPEGEIDEEQFTETVTAIDSLFGHLNETWEVLW